MTAILHRLVSLAVDRQVVGGILTEVGFALALAGAGLMVCALMRLA